MRRRRLPPPPYFIGGDSACPFPFPFRRSEKLPPPTEGGRERRRGRDPPKKVI